MLGVFAEFERTMIAERVCAGFARGRAVGTVLGRPPIDAGLEQRIREASGGIRKIAAQFGAGVGTVQRVKRA